MDKTRRNFSYLLLLVLILCFHLVCASHKIFKSPLEQNSQKFLDLIRYIITPQEEKIFREMPPEDRGEFVTDFWRRRDPNPETEVNEFRQQYYTRLAIADKAYKSGIPGWMTDRGRIYILLGPPIDIIRKSMGDATVEPKAGVRELSADLIEEGTLTERPTEIWVYNQYPDYFSGPLRLVFVDYESTGDYKLTTDVEVKPFSMMTYIQSDPNMIKYQWIGEIEKEISQPDFLPFMYYTTSIGKIEKDKEGNYAVACVFEIPFRAISLREEKGHYVYDLELSVETKNLEQKGTYGEKKEISEPLSLENLKKNIKEGISLTEYMIIPLEKGTNQIYFSLRDNVQQKRLRKLEIIRIK